MILDSINPVNLILCMIIDIILYYVILKIVNKLLFTTHEKFY